MGHLFSMQGRIGRRHYFVSSLGVVCLTYGLAFAVGFTSGVSGGSLQHAGLLGLMVGILGCAMQGFLAVRRLHDLGKPGWHYWLFFVPFYNVYLWLVLCFARGTESANSHGPAPA